MKTTPFGRLNELETLMVWNMDSAYVDSLTNINSKITAADSIESLWKEVNELALKYVLPKDTLLDSTNRAKLIAIAELCPLCYGPAVYRARAYLCSIDNDPRIALNDCERPSLPQPPSQRLAGPEDESGPEEDENELRVSVYPNPNRGDLTINVTGGNEDDVYTFVVVNLIGEHVYSVPLHSGENTVNLPLAAGSYLYRIDSKDGTTIEKGNVVILQE